MVSTRPPTSKSSSRFNNPLVTVPKAPITIGITVTFMFHSFFNSLARSRYLSLFSHSSSFILQSTETAKSIILQIFFFFVDYYKVWSSSRDQVIRLYIKVPQEFVCVIFQEKCWVVHIPFVGMVKFKFLAHFPVDYLAHPVVSSLVHLLCQFAAFADYVIDGFIIVIAQSAFAILLRLIYPRFNMIGSYGAVLCSHQEGFCFSLKVSFLSHVQVFSCEMLFISHLKRPWGCFPSHFCFLVFVIQLSIVMPVLFLIAVISPLVFFYVVFELLYGCVNAIFDAGKTSSSLFSWYI